MPLYGLTEELVFPPARRAGPGGLLAIGGDLSVERLVLAYRSGIFPWFSETDPILWWSPNPRWVLFPANLRVSHSMRPLLRRQAFRVTYDRAFSRVIAGCATARRTRESEPWLVPAMQKAYVALHEAGYAHSVEVWEDERLAGGLYGVAMGRCFFGESMFTEVSNASKYGFITLVGRLQAWGFTLIDCQVHTGHLESLGAEAVPRSRFLTLLNGALADGPPPGRWNPPPDAEAYRGGM